MPRKKKSTRKKKKIAEAVSAPSAPPIVTEVVVTESVNPRKLLDEFVEELLESQEMLQYSGAENQKTLIREKVVKFCANKE